MEYHIMDWIILSGSEFTKSKFLEKSMLDKLALLHFCLSAPYRTLVLVGAFAPKRAVVSYTKFVHVQARRISPVITAQSCRDVSILATCVMGKFTLKLALQVGSLAHFSSMTIWLHYCLATSSPLNIAQWYTTGCHYERVTVLSQTFKALTDVSNYRSKPVSVQDTFEESFTPFFRLSISYILTGTNCTAEAEKVTMTKWPPKVLFAQPNPKIPFKPSGYLKKEDKQKENKKKTHIEAGQVPTCRNAQNYFSRT